MDNKNLNYFATIAETGNLTVASKKLYTTQPALTQYLNRLEDELNVSLIDSSRSPLTLTKAGELYLDFLKKQYELIKEFKTDLSFLTDSAHGNIKIGIPLQIQQFITNEIFTKYIDENPGIRISFNDKTSPILEKMVCDNELDAAIIHSDYDNKSLEYIKLKEENIFMLCNKNNPILNGFSSTELKTFTAKNISDFENGNFYLADKSLLLRKKSEFFLSNNNIITNHYNSLSSINAILNLISIDTNGIAFVPDNYYYAYGNKESLAFISMESLPIKWHLTLTYRKSDKKNTTLNLFIEAVKEIYGIK